MKKIITAAFLITALISAPLYAQNPPIQVPNPGTSKPTPPKQTERVMLAGAWFDWPSFKTVCLYNKLVNNQYVGSTTLTVWFGQACPHTTNF